MAAKGAPAVPPVEPRCLPLDKQPPNPNTTKGNDPKRLPRSVPLMTISSQNEITGPLLILPSDCSINIPDTSINELRNRFEETMRFPFAQCERTRFQRNSWMLRKGDCGAQVHKRCDQCELLPHAGAGYMRCLAQCNAAAAGGKKKGKKGKKKKKRQSEDMHRSSVPAREEGGYSPDEENADMVNDKAVAQQQQATSITKHKSWDESKEVELLEMQKNEILSKFNSRELLETLEQVVLRKTELELKERQMQFNKQPWVPTPQTQRRETPYLDLDGVPSKEALVKMKELIKENESSISSNKKTNNVKFEVNPKESGRSRAAAVATTGATVATTGAAVATTGAAAENKEIDLPSTTNRARQSATTTWAMSSNEKPKSVVMTTVKSLENPFDAAAQRKKRELEHSTKKLATKSQITGCIKKVDKAISKSRDLLEATSAKDNLSHTGAILSRRSSQSKIRKSTIHPQSQDPVARYHYYRRQWQQFRNQIPGEDKCQNLRRPIHPKSKDDDK